MVLLAIESSGRQVDLSLATGDGVVLRETAGQDGRTDADFITALDQLYSTAGLSPGATEVLGISIGPGSFTGLRIAVSAAKMIAEVTGAAIHPIPSALVAAEATLRDAPPDGRVVVALASKRNTYWRTEVQHDNGSWRITQDGVIEEADSFAGDASILLLADCHFPHAAREAAVRAGCTMYEPVLDSPACLALTIQAIARGESPVLPEYLMPLYPREPEAVTIFNSPARNRG